ncbi:myosin [Striga asiatica]|uniref:Myosin n=1 Tax=Striga asiatica TaxID=4170 RepID=A0A5A7PRU6_STRAF|nr:myosin [Striga asiatica]
MALRKGSRVWLEDKDSAWVEAEVFGFIGKQVQVLTLSGKKVLTVPEKLQPRDGESDLGGVDDMTKLTYLNEPGVLDNLRRRYGLNEIYTYTGSILIAVNPFTKLPHLYNMHMMEQYKGAPFGELSPHVFAVADASYRAMMSEGRSQSILVSGESGAGKTETTKLIMQYLTYVGGRAAEDDRSVEQQVLESNPLLEAFGNARTVRNDNSSRFGKFVEIQFDANGRISGAAIRTYLLERSRVVQITDPERNYHCFYQLCASGMDAETYKLGHPRNFHYLNQSKTYELDGVSNGEEYVKTRRAMDIVGISDDEQEAIFRTLAGILHLGNVEFSPGKEHDSSVIKDQKSNFHLQMAADLFRCDVSLLLATLTTRSIQTHEGIIVKALDCGAAVAGRDTLAKTVYARLFDWLVEKINRSVGQDRDSKIQIGVLDIYGFECFKLNSFEQFCINFANEKLQQHFNEHVFKMEQEEYQREEINWSYIEFIDNQDVLDLIEKGSKLDIFHIRSNIILVCNDIKRPIGIIALLDEACMFPKSTHETFSNKLFRNFHSHRRLEKAKFSETDFIISHYAGKVSYQTETFLDKNRDYVVVEHCNLLASSTCHFISGLFPPLPEESARSSYKFSSVASRFKVLKFLYLSNLFLLTFSGTQSAMNINQNVIDFGNGMVIVASLSCVFSIFMCCSFCNGLNCNFSLQQLQALMETLSSTEPHYVRCVKPNSLNKPHSLISKSMAVPSVFGKFLWGELQEKEHGVLEAVRISLAGYPTRKTYHEFVDRFGIIALDVLDTSYDDKTMTEIILQRLNLENFQLGKNKVFLRAGQIAILDSRRAEVLDSAAKRIQGRLRTFVARKDFVTRRFATLSLQACCRGYLARNKFAAMRETAAVVVMQTYFRRWFILRAYKQLHLAAVLIQSCIHGFSTRRMFSCRKEEKAATVIQARWRMFKVRSLYRNRQNNIIAIQCLWRQKLAKRELRKLKKEANEAGALRLAKTKLEKQLEDLTWRLHLEKKIRVSNEEAKLVEISKLQKTVESLTLELEAARLATLNEFNKNRGLERQLEISAKEKSGLERDVISLAELRNENTLLKSSLNALEEKNKMLESELAQTKEDASNTMTKLRDVEKTCLQYQLNLRSLEEKLSNLEKENHILRQKTLDLTPRTSRAGFVKPFLEKFSGPLALSSADQKSYESPTPSKLITPISQGFSDSRRTKSGVDRHQGNFEVISRCIKENLGFKDAKPVAACVIYKCLVHWHAFESERTAIFDFVIESINGVLKDGDEDATLPYWLSNTSALLCLLQRNLRSNGFLTAGSQRSVASTGINGKLVQGPKSSFKYRGLDDGLSQSEAKYPALLFKQQLTASVEKIFGWIRDNLKKEISPLLGQCIQAPKNQRVHGGKSSRSPTGAPQQSPSSEWDSIIKFLDSFMSRLRGNYVPSFFIRKLTTQVFSFINIQLFNSLLLRRECCTFSNGEYVKSGLAELEKWIVNATEEFAGTSWHELNYIRQAVGFLVIHQKRKKSLEEIRQDLCPKLTVRQIYRISTMYWDDKYGTQSVSNEVVSQMREIVNKDSQNLSSSNSFLLDDDLSIPFSTEDVYMAIPAIDPSDMDLPPFFSEYPSAQQLLQNLK